MSAQLGVVVRLAGTRLPVPLGELSEAERAQIPEGQRRRDWLLGRGALKALLGGADTAALSFPHRSLSLTHAGGLAVAAQVRDVAAVAGTGVDYESRRPTDRRTARFFLHEREETGCEDLLRLWTVKEALFKATPENEHAVLLDYHLDDPLVLAGEAVGSAGQRFRYASTYVEDGWVTVAVSHAAR